METHPAPAGSQTLPCDRCYSQSIPRSQRQSWGLSSYPQPLFLSPLHTPFPSPAARSPRVVLRCLFLHRSCSGGCCAACPSAARGVPAALPGNLPACQRRGFGKEAASNHSCGWDVVSILSPSFLLLVPRLIPSTYPNQSRSAAAAGGARAVPEAPAQLGRCPTHPPQAAGLPGTRCLPRLSMAKASLVMTHL